jgi:hypothetical protein
MEKDADGFYTPGSVIYTSSSRENLIVFAVAPDAAPQDAKPQPGN